MYWYKRSRRLLSIRVYLFFTAKTACIWICVYVDVINLLQKDAPLRGAELFSHATPGDRRYAASTRRYKTIHPSGVIQMYKLTYNLIFKVTL